MPSVRSKLALLVLLLAPGPIGCAEFAPDDVGASDSDIIGGSDAVPGEFPWQAQLQVPGFPHWCGGSIIDDRWILTASHCVQGKTPGNFTVRAGLHQRSAPDAHVQTRGVVQIIQHPAYNPSTLDNDIALLELSSPLTFTPRVQPIDIADSNAAVGALAPVSGWGQTAPASASADVLQKTVLPVESTATCNAAGTLPLLVRPSMVCAGFEEGEHGGCHGDSGGPLVVQRDAFGGGFEQIGVVSWGVGGTCSSYTVFARLSVLAAWIHAQTGPVAIYGDVDGSGCVDAADESAIVAAFGQTVPPASPALDLDHNGVINIFDRLVVLQNFGDGCP